MIDLRVVRGSTTGELLKALLRERHVELGQPGQAIVSYGVTIDNPGVPCLNANAGKLNKYEELDRLQAAGILVPYHNLTGSELQFPILGRKFKHSKGRDIIPILQNDQEFAWRKQGGHSDFFVQYIPRKTEYRAWVYRRRSLGVYEKVMRYPERYTRIGANYQNGFAFEFLPQEGRDPLLVELGAKSVEALDLDFGAVDILRGVDDKLWVLEVNTAPGQETVRTAMTNLANKIARWVEMGCPRRRGDGEQG